jgi:hypothetical protein
MLARHVSTPTVALVAAIAALTLVSTAAASTPGSCSAASPPVIASGSTENSDANACPSSGGLQYWAMNLQVGDMLTVNGTPTTDDLSVDVHGPDVQTIGESLCGSGRSFSAFTVSCVIPKSGSYLLVASGAGPFTPSVSSVPAEPSRVAGSCSAATAPDAVANVTQYTNSKLCQSAAGLQYWAINLQVGDLLTVNGTPTTDDLGIDVYGPHVQTIGESLCGSGRSFSAFTVSCVIPKSGSYLLVARGAGPFTPSVSSVSVDDNRVAGSCSAATAPNAVANVTQYTNSKLCQSVAGLQYWAMNLQVGDMLTVNGTPTTDALSVDAYGPDVQTIGESLCGSGTSFSAFALSCPIPKSGSYLLVASGAGPFTPHVGHPLLDALQRALLHWSPLHGRPLHVRAWSPARTAVCVFVVSSGRAPASGSQPCGAARARPRALAVGRRLFARAGNARITIRFSRQGQRLLANGHPHKLTLITTYAPRGDAPASTSRQITIRPRRR